MKKTLAVLSAIALMGIAAYVLSAYETSVDVYIISITGFAVACACEMLWRARQ